jgi:hypothetical protein
MELLLIPDQHDLELSRVRLPFETVKLLTSVLLSYRMSRSVLHGVYPIFLRKLHTLGSLRTLAADIDRIYKPAAKVLA